jgi:16S rRNA (cytidine1402-2'-O)-methyltransferase
MKSLIPKSEKGILFMVGTPIGNLDDITLRALKILKMVDWVACEDTRVSQKLLKHYEISAKTISCHQHSKQNKLLDIVRLMKNGQQVAYISDAGTPGISDPGNQLVALALENNIQIVPLPGASALNAIISVAGIDLQKFIFLAYPPHKKGRETFFNKIISSDLPVIYYDSVHRVIKNLKLLAEKKPQVKIILGRELTKLHEEIKYGSVEDIINYYEDNLDKVRGEFVIIVENK